MEERDQLDRVLQKIQKLLALKGSPVQAEAEAAAIMAHKLMMKYKVSIQDLEIEQEQIEESEITSGHRLKDWRRTIYDVTARTNFCRAVYSRYSGGYYRKDFFRVRFVGKKAHIATATWMAVYLIGAIDRIAKQQIPRQAKQQYRREFRLGMAYTIAYNLSQMYHQEEIDPETRAVVVTEDKALHEYLDQLGGEEMVSVKAPRGSRAFYRGLVAGEQVQLSIQVEA